tara:strand:+ start:1024 stop:1278 length:255 start_codon:yes stop_codon:yes gene_type:complete
MKMEVLTVKISNENVRDLYKAKTHLLYALSALSQQKIKESLGESLFYDLMKEMNNLVSGMDICMEIAEEEVVDSLGLEPRAIRL